MPRSCPHCSSGDCQTFRPTTPIPNSHGQSRLVTVFEATGFIAEYAAFDSYSRGQAKRFSGLLEMLKNTPPLCMEQDRRYPIDSTTYQCRDQLLVWFVRSR